MEDSTASHLRAILNFKCKGNHTAVLSHQFLHKNLLCNVSDLSKCCDTNLCCNPLCENNPFICYDYEECACMNEDQHEYCPTRKIGGIVKQMTSGCSLSEEDEQSYDCLIQFYEKLIAQLKKDQEEIIQKKKYHNLDKVSMELVQKVESQQFESMKGEMFHRLIQQLNLKPHTKINSDLQSVTQKLNKIKSKLDIIRKQISHTVFQCCMLDIYHDSVISYFPKLIKRTKMLFSAKEHKFSAAKFHELCDHIPHTLIIIENQFGKLFGGYTILSWNQDLKQYFTDTTKQSFIFSLSENLKFPLVQPQCAIFCKQNNGPIFGGGHDIHICDRCDQNRGSSCNFPFSYNNGLKQSKQSIQLLTGSKNTSFRVVNYEVYQIEFV